MRRQSISAFNRYAIDEHQGKPVSSLLTQLKDIATGVMYAAEASTIGEVLERIADTSRELVRAKYAALGIPDGEGGLQYFKFSGLSKEEASHIGHLPEGRGLLGEIMHTRKPIRVDRIQSHPASIGFPPNHPAMERFLGVPIQVGMQLFGMLYLTDRKDGLPFDENDQWLIETIAGYAALAIAGAQIREQSQRLTLLEERERISMELHDGVIQSLYAIGMHLELLRVTGSTDPEALRTATQNLNAVIDDIRSYILNLKTRDPNKETIRECLQSVLNRLHVPPSMEVQLNAPHTPMPFSPTNTEAICQMAMEAVSNVIRHSEASRLVITADESDKKFYLTIQDNGRGFDIAALNRSTERGLGLRNLLERARLLHGTADVHSSPKQGTTIAITLPTLPTA